MSLKRLEMNKMFSIQGSVNMQMSPVFHLRAGMQFIPTALQQQEACLLL